MHYFDYNEKKRHGTDNFPLAYYHVTEQHPRYKMPFHWHRETELIRIAHGHLCLYLDDREYHLTEGDFSYISEGVIHGGEPDNCIYECIVFDLKPLLQTQAIRSCMFPIKQHQIAIEPCFHQPSSPLGSHLEHLFSCVRFREPYWEITALGHLLLFYGAVFQGSYYETLLGGYSGHSRIHLLKSVLEYIDANYNLPISLADLSRIAGMSPKYFCRFFHTAIHRTPIDYVNYYRVEQACFLMETEEISITEAAYRCGFNDSAYFIRVFKKYKGITPKQFIRKRFADSSLVL